jgi:hypothetical protein
MAWDHGVLVFVRARLILLLGLFAAALFLMGPQMGSLDVDGDGIPEVPIAVAQTRIATPLSSLVRNEQKFQTTYRSFEVVSAAIGLQSGVAESEFGIPSCYTPLQVSCILRC